MYLTAASINPKQVSFLHLFTRVLGTWLTAQPRKHRIRYVGISEFSPHLKRDMGILDGHDTPQDSDGFRRPNIADMQASAHTILQLSV